ncbi:hypothetical protein KDL45_17000 [bacterium]|nr:hypothetical protein [bacterium]
MEFVDDFRRAPRTTSINEAIDCGKARLDALVAATVEKLCQEAGIEPPTWTSEIGPIDEPWLVSGIESLRGLAFAESPVPFRRRRIFVLANFLQRA